jgi:SAM-dependent methyltransferase
MANEWTAGLTPVAARELRVGFDDDAEVYERTRPVCPPELFADLIRLARLAPGDRVLEIAPGTGQATVPLAERGLAVTAVELGPALAAAARRRLARFPAVEVVTRSFEDWQPPDQVEPWHFPPPGPDVAFTETATRCYPFTKRYRADDYLAQLATQAGTRELGPVRAADFLDRVRRRLTALGSPTLTATFVACLTIATRR